MAHKICTLTTIPFTKRHHETYPELPLQTKTKATRASVLQLLYGTAKLARQQEDLEFAVTQCEKQNGVGLFFTITTTPAITPTITNNISIAITAITSCYPTSAVPMHEFRGFLEFI